MTSKKPPSKKASSKKARKAATKGPAKAGASKKATVKKSARKPAATKARATPAGTMPAEGEAGVLAFIQKLPEPQRALVARLHRILMDAVPGLQADIKWNMPTYSQNGAVGYVAPFTKHVNLGFFRGSELADLPPEGIGKGGRHIKLRSLDDIDAPRFTRWVKEAVRLGNNVRR